MAVRDLSNLVKADDVISTEHLVTLLVVVSKYSQKDWLSHYETLSSFVVCGELRQCQQLQVICLMHCWLVWSVCCFVSFVALCGCCDTMVCWCRSHGPQRNCQRTMSMHCTQWLCFVRWQTHSKHLLVRRVFRCARSLCRRVKHICFFYYLGFMTQIWQLIFSDSCGDLWNQVRDFEFDPEGQMQRSEELDRLQHDQEILQTTLLQWCYASYGEVPIST
jgi:hypothetical protein